MPDEKKKSDSDAWAETLKDVRPLKKASTIKAKTPRPRGPRREQLSRRSNTPPPKSQSPFDPKLYKQISTGKALIDESIDLHGYTEERAFMRLINAIEAAWARGARRLLIITGKGRGGTGAIHDALPKWLSSPRLTPFVSTFDYSHPRHGGDGAFYVILRKQQ